MQGQETVNPGSESEAFESYFRGLVLGAVARSARSEQEFQQALGHRRRARRAGLVRLELDRLQGLAQPTGPAAELSGQRGAGPAWLLTAAWVAAGAFLVAALGAFGVHSWWTGGGDVTLLVASCAWFLADARRISAPAALRRPVARR